MMVVVGKGRRRILGRAIIITVSFRTARTHYPVSFFESGTN